jgi:murein DD-endopeptidase MepM/ murein hydrolase activator NlpD
MRIALCLLLFALAATASAQGYALREVEAGESLGLIADRYGVEVEQLRSANGLEDNLIYPGQLLRVPLGEATGGIVEAAPAPPPGFRRHTLAAGETLSSIADRYGQALESLIGANPDLSSMDRLPVGVELLIPTEPGMIVAYDSGETLLELTDRYGVGPADVVRANELASPLDLRPGMLLFLPGVRPVEALERLARVRELENIYVWPVHGRLTSYFGRRNLGLGTSSFHRGLDVAAPHGTPILAARSGTVTFAGWSSQGYGYLVKIHHAGGDETWYAHQSQIHVEVGQGVRQGDVIGRIGSTGVSTGPHLHFELHRRGQALDPLTELN